MLELLPWKSTPYVQRIQMIALMLDHGGIVQGVSTPW